MSAWDQLNAGQMAEFLIAALRRGLPGPSAQRVMAHGLAYGRHRGPIPNDARRAAVLVALHQTARGWSLPAILRPESMKAHGGQVSLPGGLIESDETVAQAALREFEEELGAAAAALQIIGPLTPIYVFVSGFEVTPLLAVSREPLVFDPNPQEVAAVVELPLAELADLGCRGRHWIERRGLRFSVPHFAVGGQQVWGATSLILAELVGLMNST
jgi:8-oxo-dGTP pyrophosphatase MutT (NUDIX family)